MTTQTQRRFATLLLGVSLAPHEIGEQIAAARRAKGWTQLEFAYEMRVSPSAVQRWEAGKLPRLKRLRMAADVLGIPIERLVAPEGRPDGAVAERLGQIERAQAEQAELLRELLARLGRDERAEDR